MQRNETALWAAIMLVLLQSPILHAAEGETARITTRPLGELLIKPTYSNTASVVSLNDSQLSAEISARITNLPVQVGDQVKKDKVLLRFDCRQPRYALRDAEARLQLAQKEATRAKALRKSSNIAEQNFNRTQTELERAQIARQQQQLAVSHCTLKAPFSGTVTEKQAALGELAVPGSPLLRLVDSENLEVSASLLPDQIRSLKQASNITLKTSNKTYPLKLRAVVPVINAVSNSQEVRLVFQDEAAIPGDTGRLSWRTETAMIPSGLMLRRSGEVGMFTMENGEAVFIKLDTTDTSQPVPNSLPESTAVVIDGRFGLNHGDPVTLRDE